MKNKRNLRKKIAIATGGVVVAGVMCLALSFTTVSSGQVGLRVRLGKVESDTLSEGLNWRVPVIERIVKVNLKVQKAEVETISSSKDLQEVAMTLVVNYKINREDAVELYKNVGLNYDEVVLRPSIEESIKAVTSRYTAEQLITRRSEVSDECLDELSSKVAKYGIEVCDLNITNFTFSDAFDNAIEEKQIAEQHVLTAERELAREKIEAEKLVVKAEAEKKANEIISESLTNEVLAQHFLEKWDGKLPEYVGFGDEVGITKMLK